ncbi:hypothetical protein CAC42_7023 [Sphaceloma murrayae]|uniref:Senescence domain-containing protein n=1 Tax=Sphaceloma murrayae TaxID=2082308 RepID=A0A2K1QQX3_9PEZI|nr:hypothetical protein CAC42_7023 [Sphaceloma murrayae]
MSDHNDPRLLFSVGGVKAYHIQDGHEASLTPSGPQTLSLLMVPTTSQYAPPQNQLPDQDFYLHLNLPPELDLPMPATTQIYHQPPTSYLIPRWDLSPESGAFTRIEFPAVGKGPGTIGQEDIDTFETILAQCTAFLERATPPKPGRPLNEYNPADYKKTGYPDEKGHGHVVLVDEENGSVVGELAEGANVVEHPSLQHGSKSSLPLHLTLSVRKSLTDEASAPVEIQISADGKRVDVRPISEDYLELAKMPQYQKSTLVQNAAAASRLIVTGSSYLGNMMSQGADNFVNKTKPVPKPMEFAPATHERVRKINNFTHGAAGMSAKTVGQVSKYAQNFGANLSRRKEKEPRYDEKGRPISEQPSKPGLLNKSMIAFTTLADGIAYSGKTLLTQSGAAASTVVGHRWGDQAGSITAELAGGVKNVGLVYIDVTGVSRRAVVKSVAKGMVVGKMKDGQQVVVGGGDGGDYSNAELKAAEAAQQQAIYQGQSSGHYAQGAGQFAPPPTQEYGSVAGGSGGGAPPPAYTPNYNGPGQQGPPRMEGKGEYRY